MKRILVIGCFKDKTNRLDGQIVKTRDIYAMLQTHLMGKCHLSSFNTLSVRDNKFLLFELFFKLLLCDTVILIPADHSLEKFFPYLFRLSKIVRYKIIQTCVGGWQVDFFIGRGKWKAHPLQMKMSRKCKAFLPEIEKVNEELKELCHFNNSEVFPNFRRNIPDISNINNSIELKLVWLARINRDKGFETVFRLAEKIKKENWNITISFYGRIEDDDKSLFYSLLESNKDVVSYHGQLSAEQIAQTLCYYDVMLLPTKYYTEGFPGTILDAYISGLPVIVTEWMHAREFVDDGLTGFIVPFNNSQEDFNMKVAQLYNDRALLKKMKKNARDKVRMFTEERAWNVINKYL